MHRDSHRGEILPNRQTTTLLSHTMIDRTPHDLVLLSWESTRTLELCMQNVRSGHKKSAANYKPKKASGSCTMLGFFSSAVSRRWWRRRFLDLVG